MGQAQFLLTPEEDRYDLSYSYPEVFITRDPDITNMMNNIIVSFNPHWADSYKTDQVFALSCSFNLANVLVGDILLFTGGFLVKHNPSTLGGADPVVEFAITNEDPKSYTVVSWIDKEKQYCNFRHACLYQVKSPPTNKTLVSVKWNPVFSLPKWDNMGWASMTAFYNLEKTVVDDLLYEEFSSRTSDVPQLHLDEFFDEFFVLDFSDDEFSIIDSSSSESGAEF